MFGLFKKKNYQEKIISEVHEIIKIQEQFNVKMHGHKGGGFMHFSDIPTWQSSFKDIDYKFIAFGEDLESTPFDKRFTEENYKKFVDFKNQFKNLLNSIDD